MKLRKPANQHVLRSSGSSSSEPEARGQGGEDPVIGFEQG